MSRYRYHGRRRKADRSLTWSLPCWLAWRDTPLAEHFLITAPFYDPKHYSIKIESGGLA